MLTLAFVLALHLTSPMWCIRYLAQSLVRFTLEQVEELKELPFKRRGRPLYIGEELDKQVQAYYM